MKHPVIWRYNVVRRSELNAEQICPDNLTREGDMSVYMEVEDYLVASVIGDIYESLRDSGIDTDRLGPYFRRRVEYSLRVIAAQAVMMNTAQTSAVVERTHDTYDQEHDPSSS